MVNMGAHVVEEDHNDLLVSDTHRRGKLEELLGFHGRHMTAWTPPLIDGVLS